METLTPPPADASAAPALLAAASILPENGTPEKGGKLHVRSGRKSLLDITNDSPVAGLAKSIGLPKKIPGLGESAMCEEDPEVDPLKECFQLESSDKSESSAAPIYKDSGCSFPEKPIEDDSSSVWSIQANASTKEEEDGDEEEELEEEFYSDGDDDDGVRCDGEEEWEDAGSLLDDLCEGLGSMAVLEESKKAVPEFAGKHTRFVYNSDGEIEGEEEVGGIRGAGSPGGAMRLRGLPLPEGKHLRFPDDDDEN